MWSERMLPASWLVLSKCSNVLVVNLCSMVDVTGHIYHTSRITHCSYSNVS